MLQGKQIRFSEKAKADNRFSTRDLRYSCKSILSPVMPFLTIAIFPLLQLLPELTGKHWTSPFRERMNQSHVHPIFSHWQFYKTLALQDIMIMHVRNLFNCLNLQRSLRYISPSMMQLRTTFSYLLWKWDFSQDHFLYRLKRQSWRAKTLPYTWEWWNIFQVRMCTHTCIFPPFCHWEGQLLLQREAKSKNEFLKYIS